MLYQWNCWGTSCCASDCWGMSCCVSDCWVMSCCVSDCWGMSCCVSGIAGECLAVSVELLAMSCCSSDCWGMSCCFSNLAVSIIAGECLAVSVIAGRECLPVPVIGVGVGCCGVNRGSLHRLLFYPTLRDPFQGRTLSTTSAATRPMTRCT